MYELLTDAEVARITAVLSQGERALAHLLVACMLADVSATPSEVAEVVEQIDMQREAETL